LGSYQASDDTKDDAAWKEHRTALATPLCGCVSVVTGGGARIAEWVHQIDRDGWDCLIMADEPRLQPAEHPRP